MNKQAIFDKALFGIRNQGYVQSVSDRGCSYFVPAEGDFPEMRCAIGHCLSRDNARDLQEQGGGSIDFVASGLLSPFISELEIDPTFGNDLSLLISLQRAHDVPDFTAVDWELAMKNIARIFGLHYTQPTDPNILAQMGT